MSDNLSFLITLSDGVQLFRVALNINQNMLSGDAAQYPLEPENKEKFRKLLPLHVQTAGAIVEVQEIFDVVTL